ncbi:MAG: cobalt-precorrin-5B (C(1))-methyltransferase [Hyphomicrobiales bacterium]|nr:cobalt-precorrin-5B (C(1))-methyltransferase [Hyphomicrobiales bacterium]
MNDDAASTKIKSNSELRRGWTTGTCATAAAKAAATALVCGDFPDPVAVTLPGGGRPTFALARTASAVGIAEAGVVKDAGDDPDVTHGAVVFARVTRGEPGSGVVFRAGEGVGTVTRPGLPIAVGEPAINPVPRAMIRTALEEVVAAVGGARDFVVEIGVENGRRLAEKTLNPRLGILGGLSILGTTGIVVPFSCSAWIHSIHRGVDVARAMGLAHVAGSTGNTSEKAVQVLHGLPEQALIEMGDFVGGMLKYLKTHPVPRVTVACGFAKAVKLAQGLGDLHSKRGSVDHAFLADLAARAGADAALVERVRTANSALEVLEIARAEGVGIGDAIAEAGWRTAAEYLTGTGIELEVAVFDRAGGLVATSGFRRA